MEVAVGILSGRLFGGLLYGVAPTGPQVMAGVTLLIVAVAALAVIGPTSRTAYRSGAHAQERLTGRPRRRADCVWLAWVTKL